MKAVRICAEATYYFTVLDDDGISHQYVRTPFEEWCTEINYGIMTDLSRVTKDLAKQLEQLFQESKSELI